MKNDNSNIIFAQGFTHLVQSHLPDSNYQLIDFGQGRKLERVGNVIVDRPCPGATGGLLGSFDWKCSHLAFDAEKSQSWHYRNSFSDSATSLEWRCECSGLQMRLKPTPAGQIGIFPEHWAHWSWLNERLGIKERSKLHNSRPRVLNLFAYTGATTLYLASQGCTVTHVDASKPTVDWARENCLLSGLAEAPIRWIVDDVAAYVRREIRRNRQYDAILLDPPTYGHGSQGDRWEIYRDLLPLLIDCWQLLSNERRAVLLCGHSSHISVRDLNQAIREAHGTDRLGECEVTQAYLQSLDGRRLDCGFAAKYSFDRT